MHCMDCIPNCFRKLVNLFLKIYNSPVLSVPPNELNYCAISELTWEASRKSIAPVNEYEYFMSNLYYNILVSEV